MTKVKVAPVTIKAPKVTSAWVSVCKVSSSSEALVIKSIEALHLTLTTESRLSIADKRKYIKNLEVAGNKSPYISSSHMPALPTWMALRATHEGFKALPLHKQLSTASASYDLLGSGNGEQIKTLEGLTKEIASVRKNKQTKAKASPSKAKAPKSLKDALASVYALISALNPADIDDTHIDQMNDIMAVFEQKASVSI